MSNLVIQLDRISAKYLTKVGGNNVYLGAVANELSNFGIRVPKGFVTTADAYWDFIQRDGLYYSINELMDDLDIKNVEALEKAGVYIRSRVLKQSINTELENALFQAYWDLSKGVRDVPVSLRTSFIRGNVQDRLVCREQQTYLNIRGEENFIHAFRAVIASVFDNKAIKYRVRNGFSYREEALSVVVQKMVNNRNSENSISGKMYTFRAESERKNTVLITSSYGVVSGRKGLGCSDEFIVQKRGVQNDTGNIISCTLGTKAIKRVYSDIGKIGVSLVTTNVLETDRKRFSLSNYEVCELAKQAEKIEQYHGCPVVIDWVKDNVTNQFYIVQASLSN